ncbi:MAG TPA: ester cyclase [Candidatus Cybelea sp.]|nr:ester cyclase [Candidatus Cybelea sp.]
MALSSDYRALLARHLAAENQHRLDDVLATLTPDCVFRDFALAQSFRGHEGAGRYYRLWWDAFGHVVAREKLHEAGERSCIAEVRFQGRHDGPFLGIPATGRAIDLPIAIVVDLGETLMSGERFYWDMATLLRQIGRTSLPDV